MSASASLVMNLFVKDQSSAGLRGAESGFKRFQQTVVAGSAVAGAALITAGKKAIAAASDYTEASNKTDAVFKDQSAVIRAFERESTNAWGISKKAALDYTSAMGSVLTASGVSRDAAAKLSVEYTKLAADLGSFNNTSTEEAAEALKASLTGEFEMLKKYGVVINDTVLAQEAQRQGVIKAGATWSQAQKLQLSYAIVQRATADAQGDVARNTDTAAFKQRQLQARVDDMTVSLGNRLLPIYLKFLGVMQSALTWIEKNETKVKALVIVLGSLWAITVGVAAATKVWTAVSTLATVASKAYTAATKISTVAVYAQAAAIRISAAAFAIMRGAATAARMAMLLLVTANPIGLLLVGLVAAGVAFVALWRNSETFRRIVTGAFNAVKGAAMAAFEWVKDNWPLLLAVLTGPIGIAVLLWKKFGDDVVGFLQEIPGKIGNLGGMLVDKGKQMIEGLWNGAKAVVTGLAGRVRSAIEQQIKMRIDAARWLYNAGRDIVTGLWNGIVAGLSWFWGYLSGIPEGIWRMFGNLYGSMKTIGGNVITGLWNGVASAIGWFQDRLFGWVNKLPGWVRKILGISSPSKVFAALGKEIPRGLAMGITATAGSAESAVSAMARGLAKAGQVEMGAGVGVLAGSFADRARMGGPDKGGSGREVADAIRDALFDASFEVGADGLARLVSARQGRNGDLLSRGAF